MSEDIRICFVGDSFVNGTGDETTLGWAGRVCAAALARGIGVTHYNLGIRRDTSQDILRRWARECALRLPTSCDARVVISCGVNDTVVENGRTRVDPTESCANIRAILREARKYKVIMVGPPPIDDDQQNARIRELSAVFGRESERLGVPFIELFSHLASDAEYRKELSDSDGAHPGSKGYRKIASIVGGSRKWWFNVP